MVKGRLSTEQRVEMITPGIDNQGHALKSHRLLLITELRRLRYTASGGSRK